MKGLAEQVEPALEILNEVESLLKISSHIFLSDEDYDNQSDDVYELPIHITTDHHCTFYLQYVVLSINKGYAYCGGLSEEYGTNIKVPIGELSYDTIIQIAKQL